MTPPMPRGKCGRCGAAFLWDAHKGRWVPVRPSTPPDCTTGKGRNRRHYAAHLIERR